MTDYNPMTDHAPGQHYDHQESPDSNAHIAALERDEATARQFLATIGFRLLRSDKKPGTANQPAYKIISASRLTFNEVLQFLEKNIPMKGSP